MKKQINLEIPVKLRKKANKLYKKIGIRREACNKLGRKFQDEMNTAGLNLAKASEAFNKYVYGLAPDLQGEIFGYTPQNGIVTTMPGMDIRPMPDDYNEGLDGEIDADYNC